MPNHTSNRLIATGKKEDVDAFVEKCKGETSQSALDFNAFIMAATTIDAQRVAWGTKWNAYSISLDYEGSSPLVALASATIDDPVVSATYTFDTAWCYPETVIEAIFEQHPELTFEHSYLYEDGGGGTNGRDYSHEFRDESEECRQLTIDLQGYDPWTMCNDCGEDGAVGPHPGYKQCTDCIESEREYQAALANPESA